MKFKVYLSKNINQIFILLSLFFFGFSILNSYHNLPWVSFYSEKYAFISLFFIILFCLKVTISLPKIILPVLLMSFLPLLQYFFGQIIFFETAFLSFIYLFCFLISIVVAFNLIKEQKKNENDPIYIFSLIFASVGIVSSIFIVIQWLNFYNFQPYIIQLKANRPFGNLAQPNQMATILLMGIVSLFYLYERKEGYHKVILALILFLTFAVALTQSRTSWLVFLVMIPFFLYKEKKIALKVSNRFLCFIFVFYIVNVLALPLYNRIFLYFGFGIIETSDALTRASTGHLRLGVWQHFIHALMEKPFLGYGFYQTQFANVSFIEKSVEGQVLDSSHNIILDLLIWCGIPIGVAISLYFTIFFFASLFKLNNAKMLYLFSIVAIILIHALLEYPLFYSYFLFPFGFAIGGLITQYNLASINIKKWINQIVFLVVVGSLFFVNIGYEYMFKKRLNITIDEDYRVLDKPKFIPESVMFIVDEYFYDRSDFIINWITFNPYVKLDNQSIKNIKEKVLVTSTQQSLLKLAVLLAYNGKKEEALGVLLIIENIYNNKIQYDKLLDKDIYDKICRFCS